MRLVGARRWEWVAGIVRLCDRNRYVAGLLGERGWGERERGLRQVRDLVETLAGLPRSLAESAKADVRMSRALPPQLLAGVPAFRDIVSSLVYSVPVPAPRGERAHAEPMRWACQVLAEPDRVDTAGWTPNCSLPRGRAPADPRPRGCARHLPLLTPRPAATITLVTGG